MFPFFFKRTADILAPRLAVVFLRLLLSANVTPIPKGPPSSSVANHIPISLTLILSKVFEHLVSFRLDRFIECRGVLPTTEFAYRSLDTCDALLCVAHTLQSVFFLRLGRRLELFRSTSVPLLTRSTIRGSSPRSVLWDFEVLNCLF